MPKPVWRPLLATTVPLLFVIVLPIAALTWYVVAHPATPAEARISDRNAQIQAKIRRCSIGLDRGTCERAFYCASDPAQCARIMDSQTPTPDDRAAY